MRSKHTEELMAAVVALFASDRALIAQEGNDSTLVRWKGTYYQIIPETIFGTGIEIKIAGGVLLPAKSEPFAAGIQEVVPLSDESSD